MEQFFVSPSQVDEEGGLIHVGARDAYHMKNVLRYRPGQEVVVQDGSGQEYHCVLTSFPGPQAALLSICYTQDTSHELPCQIYLFQGLPKSDKMDLIIQKAVELGVHQILPVQMHRCVVRLEGEKAAKKTQRWQAVAESAAKQSGRSFIPQVGEVLTFEQALLKAKECSVILIPYEKTKGMEETRRILKELSPGQSIAIFIGPEGGFEDWEVEQAKEGGALPISLGKRILRTETAGLALLSYLMISMDERMEPGGEEEMDPGEPGEEEMDPGKPAIEERPGGETQNEKGREG